MLNNTFTEKEYEEIELSATFGDDERLRALMQKAKGFKDFVCRYGTSDKGSNLILSASHAINRPLPPHP
ncbi:MAG: hypothetical protein RM022_001050 [Nostoc sp. EfeVER01]|uniref:hypothetical protein n=1 Tax=Nostoc sp. EfeVER01 TaxID=3075406 RepID=UPI002ADCE48E|nr:hypothetical protein [Nostoc sp. EfeVER01]